jgi:hypothetical protein
MLSKVKTEKAKLPHMQINNEKNSLSYGKGGPFPGSKAAGT